MKKPITKRLASLLCALVLLAAAVVPVFADGGISVYSPPTTDGVTCSSCGMRTMVSTGNGRSTEEKVPILVCPNTHGLEMLHTHYISTFYTSYICSNCGYWGEKVTATNIRCSEAV